MRRILAIAGLTWKAAFRYRLFWVMAVLLIGAVVGLPLLIKDDGTAQGMTQILITYTLSAITGLLGFFTLWFSCGTLARDIEECQMQVITTKPIARWQIWLGKWLGVIALNAMLLALAGASVYFLLQVRARRLSADQQKILREEIFVGRASIKEHPPNLGPAIDKFTEQRMRTQKISEDDYLEVRKQVAAELQAEIQEVRPGYPREWDIDLSTLKDQVRGQPLQIRVKFHSAQTVPDATYETLWRVGPRDSGRAAQIEQILPADSYQEFQTPPDLLDSRGHLIVDFFNVNNTALLFPIEDGFELLYRESSFELNFARGLVIILCWLSFLAAVGLAAASFLSFTVAAFASLAVLLMGLSSGTLSSVIEQGTIFGFNQETGKYNRTFIDFLFIPFFKGVLYVIKLVQGFSPIDSLSTGRSVTWHELDLAVAQIILLLGGIFCVVGIALFTRRELAAAQSNP